MSPNPYPSDTLKCMRYNEKVSMHSTISTLIAMITPPTAIYEDESYKIQQAIGILCDVLDNWNKHKE